MNQIVILCSYALLLAVCAVVYSVMCTEPGEIFSGWYKFLERKLMAKTYYTQRQPPEVQEVIRNDKVVYVRKVIMFYGKTVFSWNKKVKDHAWLFKPLIGCERCVSGQMALWGYFFIYPYEHLQGSLLWHILFICTTIYFSSLIKTLYLWMKNYQANH